MKVVLLDFSNLLHIIHHRLTELNCFQAEYVTAFLKYLNDRLWFVSPEPVSVLWLLDSKPYWRTIYEPEYKANRYYSPEKIKASQMVRECFFNCHYPYLAINSFEADDLASGFIRSTNFEHYYVVSTDNDWLGMVGPKVTRINPTFKPNFCGQMETWDWHCKTIDKAPKKYCVPKENLEGFSATKVWHLKSVIGDKSDNLPPGSALGLIDLYEPIEDVCDNDIFHMSLNALTLKPKLWKQDILHKFSATLPDLPIAPMRQDDHG